MTIPAPFPWFGGKSRAAKLVWERFGDPANYIEPFFGSGAVLLGRPHVGKIETVNDIDGYVVNFWRAVQHDPEQVAKWADWPASEIDLTARHIWLVQNAPERLARLQGDPDFYDAKIAGWWVWGISLWIGSGWCVGKGPWASRDGKLVYLGEKERDEGVHRKLIAVGDGGRGVHRKLIHLGTAGTGITRLSINNPDKEIGCNRDLYDYMLALAQRLRYVRVCCGDWTRVVTGAVLSEGREVAIFLDPPYSAEAGRDEVYSADDFAVAHAVREWAIANGDNPRYRIALCGYDGEHDMPDSWECVARIENGGYSRHDNGPSKANRFRERIWFSPHCLKTTLPLIYDKGV